MKASCKLIARCGKFSRLMVKVIFQQQPLKSVGLLVKDFNSMVENHMTPGGEKDRGQKLQETILSFNMF